MNQQAVSTATDEPRALLRWVSAGLVIAAIVFALYEHRSHVYGALPYLVLLACPLIHLFHGHGRHRHAAHPDGHHEPGRRPPV